LLVDCREWFDQEKTARSSNLLDRIGPLFLVIPGTSIYILKERQKYINEPQRTNQPLLNCANEDQQQQKEGW
jgi:hypothetical protein